MLQRTKRNCQNKPTYSFEMDPISQRKLLMLLIAVHQRHRLFMYRHLICREALFICFEYYVASPNSMSYKEKAANEGHKIGNMFHYVRKGLTLSLNIVLPFTINTMFKLMYSFCILSLTHCHKLRINDVKCAIFITRAINTFSFPLILHNI
jgi:hypothetical protein